MRTTDNFYSAKYHLDEFSGKSGRENSAYSRKSPRSSNRAGKRSRSSNRSLKYGRKSPNRSAPKKPKGRRALTVAVSVLIIGLIAAASCVVGYNVYIDNKKKQPFKFSENVKISGINISGLSMGEAKAKLKKNCLKAVDDISLTVVANDTVTQYTKSDFTYTFDYDTPLLSAKIYSLKEQGIYEPDENSAEPEESGEHKLPKLKLEYSFNEKSVEKLSANLAQKINREPENTKIVKFHPFSDDKFEYKEGVSGYLLDEEDLNSQITEFMLSGSKKKTITASVEELEPQLSVEDLKGKIVGLATATSTSYNTENGNKNMELALKACNGSVIEPGEIWSFNECTGDSNDPKNGYKKATVITDRKLEEGYGGGICQASTTIFRAAMFANMGIYERHNHYWASGYANSGEDATIDYPNLDLKLINPTQYQMFIECRMDGNVLLCNIYGVQEDYYDNVKIYTKNYDIVKKKTYSTHTYRVLYLDGKIVSEDIISESDYSLTDKHVVQTEDKGTFRTMVDGTTREETEPPTTAETTPKKKKKTSQTESETTQPEVTEPVESETNDETNE